MTVIVTSDHGEEFLEHGKMVHAQVYQECVHVPLLVVGPGQREGRRVSALVQSIDIAPTLFELARIPLGARPRVSGRSLAALLAGTPAPPTEREAYAEAFTSRDRALYRQTRDSFWKLVRREPAGAEAGTWISRSVSFEAREPRLRLWMASYREPREVGVQVDGVRLGSYRLDPAGRWLDLELPPGGRERRVELRSPTCTVPKEVGEGSDTRCLSFLVKGHDLSRPELYDLATDHGERHDLSLERAALTGDLARRLEAYRWKPIAAPLTKPLDAETEEQLRALGYLP